MIGRLSISPCSKAKNSCVNSLLLLVGKLLVVSHVAIASIGGSRTNSWGSTRIQNRQHALHKNSIGSLQATASAPLEFIAEATKNIDDDTAIVARLSGGAQPPSTVASPNLAQTVETATNVIVGCGKLVLPPVVACAKVVTKVYKSLPKDTIAAQIGLVYCFAGGYYPTLFSALQAAQQCGWQTMVNAIVDLTNEAIRVIDETEAANRMYQRSGKTKAELFRRQTSIVMATVNPMKINQAVAALYTTWLGVTCVLEREYVRVITMSMTMAHYIERLAKIVIAPPAYFVVEKKYHQWVPIVIGWGCKAVAMNIAWRIQRVVSAGTSALAGGLMFTRAVMRMLSKRGFKMFGMIRVDDKKTSLDEIFGFLIGGFGLYTQISMQWKSGFSFRVPFPLNLVTWPFDMAENWIQWQITK